MLSTIPASSEPFFQEHTFAKLDPREHASLVIERLLAYGNREEVRWLYDYYGKPRLQTWLAENGARLLPARRYHLWCLLMDVPPQARRAGGIWAY